MALPQLGVWDPRRIQRRFVEKGELFTTKWIFQNIVILSRKENSYTFLGSPCLPFKSTFLAKVPKRWRNGRGKWMASWPMPHCLKVLKNRWQRRDIVVSVDGRNPAITSWYVVYPIVYKVSVSQVVFPDFFHRQWDMLGWSRWGEINWECDFCLGGTEKKLVAICLIWMCV